MNFAHLHLMINELPLWAAILAALLFFIAALVIERENWVRAGLLLLCLSVLGAATAFVSGIPAVDVITNAPRTSAKALSQHHFRATVAGGFAVLSAIVAGTTVVRGRNRDEPFSRAAIIVLVATSVFQALVIAWTAQAGGRINHPELQEAGDLQEGLARPH